MLMYFGKNILIYVHHCFDPTLVVYDERTVADGGAGHPPGLKDIISVIVKI